jgi:hypothetical protein
MKPPVSTVVAVLFTLISVPANAAGLTVTAAQINEFLFSSQPNPKFPTTSKENLRLFGGLLKQLGEGLPRFVPPHEARVTLSDPAPWSDTTSVVHYSAVASGFLFKAPLCGDFEIKVEGIVTGNDTDGKLFSIESVQFHVAPWAQCV